jgi:predicted MPP superfamily phosphohydrolase
MKKTFVFQVRLLVVLVLLGGFTGLPGQEQPRKRQSFSPFVFAIISDPHVGMVAGDPAEEHFARVVAAINSLGAENRPELVLIAGDLVFSARSFDQVTRAQKIKETLAMPAYAVPGSHDQ